MSTTGFFPKNIQSLLLAVLGIAVAAPRAHAILDIEDRGPTLRVERFNLRVTNCGILGNAFFNVGRSNDPSFEQPPGSGIEGLNYATLWVGGRLEDGTVHVSGGSLLEFRPDPDPDAHVRIATADRQGAVRFADDDNDGAIDEETLNDRDDDGDGEVDEDLGMFSQQLAACTFVDDRPEAVNYVYPGGEVHRPLGITVDQEVFAWAVPGYDRAAGIRWRITNHTNQRVDDVYLGIYADLDARRRTDVTGHMNDRVIQVGYDRQIYYGGELPTDVTTSCQMHLKQSVYGIADRDTNAGLPYLALVPFSHTTDGLANFDSLFVTSVAGAPRTVGFRSRVFEVNAAPVNGGLPLTDAQRYDAMVGDYPEPRTDRFSDWAVLVSCGPFPRFGPGETIEINAVLIGATQRDSLVDQIGNLAVLERGRMMNLLPDGGAPGRSGTQGRESCIRVPPDVELLADPICAWSYGEYPPDAPYVLFPHDSCLWTDSDCTRCTGNSGRETRVPWLDPGLVPAPPDARVIPEDGQIRIEWNNLPEIMPGSERPGWTDVHFLAYRVWKIADWSRRETLLPNLDRWSLTLNAGVDAETGSIPLASLTNDSLDWERILYEKPLYPIGRYAWVDTEVVNSFDYAYFVGAVYEVLVREPNGLLRKRRVESPIRASFDDRVVPRSVAVHAAGRVHVVPNPYRARVFWDRKPVLGDAPTTHLNFVGLPQAYCTIKIWTLAGDLVQQLNHDGRSGVGEAEWDLISRNGQDIASGVYIFTVNSVLGEQIGRFVVIR